MASAHVQALEFTIKIAPASNNVNNALTWRDGSPDSSLGEKSYYYGSGVGSVGGPGEGGLNSTAHLFELGASDNNTSPNLTFKTSAMTIEMQEIGQTLTQERKGLDYPELIDITTGALMPSI